MRSIQTVPRPRGYLPWLARPIRSVGHSCVPSQEEVRLLPILGPEIEVIAKFLVEIVFRVPVILADAQRRPRNARDRLETRRRWASAVDSCRRRLGVRR